MVGSMFLCFSQHVLYYCVHTQSLKALKWLDPPFCVAPSLMLAGFITQAPAVIHNTHLGTARTVTVNISFCSLSFPSTCLVSKVQNHKKVQVSWVWILLFLRCLFSDAEVHFRETDRMFKQRQWTFTHDFANKIEQLLCFPGNHKIGILNLCLQPLRKEIKRWYCHVTFRILTWVDGSNWNQETVSTVFSFLFFRLLVKHATVTRANLTNEWP